MYHKLKEYLKLRKTRRDALTILIVNSAEAVSCVKRMAETAEKFMESQGQAMQSISETDLKNVLNFMSEFTMNNDFKDKVYEEIVKNASVR